MAYQKANQEASSGWGTALGLAAGVGSKFLTAGTDTIAGRLLGFEEGGAVDGGAIPRQVSPSGGKDSDVVRPRVEGFHCGVPGGREDRRQRRRPRIQETPQRGAQGKGRASV